jgi:metal-responsive CopG/Arc/MetJ family transcriptional regulator
MARENYLHFRVDEDLLAAVEAFAKKTEGGNRSQVCRMLLHQALGDELGMAAVEEALFEYSSLRKRVTRRLATEMSERIPTILREEMASLPVEE